MRELLHRADDLRHALDPLERLRDGARDLLRHVLEVGRVRRLPQLARSRSGSTPLLSRAATISRWRFRSTRRGRESRRGGIRMLSPTYWMGVLISCATPAARWPIPSSFCARRSCAFASSSSPRASRSCRWTETRALTSPIRNRGPRDEMGPARRERIVDVLRLRPRGDEDHRNRCRLLASRPARRPRTRLSLDHLGQEDEVGTVLEGGADDPRHGLWWCTCRSRSSAAGATSEAARRESSTMRMR